MDRRKYLKTLAVGTISTGVLLESCKTETAPLPPPPPDPVKAQGGHDRQPNEVEHFKKITGEKFFDDHEMATLTVLVDIIIPRDEKSG
ncbi:MAG: gluconate 2-dehydrogenase subunit 3 family protein, partial [Cyclobacteriaceae bacterium]